MLPQLPDSLKKEQKPNMKNNAETAIQAVSNRHPLAVHNVYTRHSIYHGNTYIAGVVTTAIHLHCYGGYHGNSMENNKGALVPVDFVFFVVRASILFLPQETSHKPAGKCSAGRLALHVSYVT